MPCLDSTTLKPAATVSTFTSVGPPGSESSAVPVLLPTLKRKGSHANWPSNISIVRRGSKEIGIACQTRRLLPASHPMRCIYGPAIDSLGKENAWLKEQLARTILAENDPLVP